MFYVKGCCVNFKYLIMACRIPTLTAILGPILVGYFLASKLSPVTFEPIYIIPILIAGLSIQIATNMFNDYLDALKDGDKEDRLGPTRITASKLVAPETVKKWGLMFCGIAFLAGIPIVLKTGWLFIVIGLFCIILSYVYTGTRFSLAYTGTADFFVIVFFGGFAVWGTFYTLTLNPLVFPFLLGLQLGCLCDIILLVNNLRDHKQDIQNSKKTLVVRFGRKFGLLNYLLFILIGFGGLFFWPQEFYDFRLFYFGLPWLCFSLYLWYWIYSHEPSAQYNKVLKLSGLIYFGYCVSLSAGFIFFM